jgi:pantoate--beta-alanine ligase
LETDLLFCPSERDIYPSGYETFVSLEDVSKKLCGAYRPNHFRGVATILTKLFHILQPHVVIFGEKDYQQLLLVKRMVQDLNFDIAVVGLPTVRETDGLALSSRNVHLNPDERSAALVLRRSLDMAEEMVAGGEMRSLTLLERIRKKVEEEPLARLEYASICDPETLEDVSQIQGGTLLALAVWIGRTRLIDNCILSLPRVESSFCERTKDGTTHAQG